jgi:hypothetical protein
MKNYKIKNLLTASAALFLGCQAYGQSAAGYTNSFDTSFSPMRYDFGSVLTPTVTFATNDAGGSLAGGYPNSGSANLSWTFSYSTKGASGADFTGDFIYPAGNYAGATVSFDIYVDTNSTPGGYNDYGYFQVATRYNGYTYGPSYLNKGLVGSGNLVPKAGQWGHVSFVLGAEAASLRALTFQDYTDSGRAMNGPMTIYIDNVKLTPSAVTNLPAISIAKPAKGLNVYAGTTGVYDRESTCLTNVVVGRSWYNTATAGNPVTYSFTINGFPQSPTSYGCVAYLWLIPNETAPNNSSDYGATNGIIIGVSQSSATNANMSFGYKVNQPGGNAMYYGLAPYTNAPNSWDGVTTPYYESGNLGSVTNSGTAVGTWQVQFTSNTNLTLIAPNGSTASYVIPPYNVGNFVDSTGYGVYLGFIANNTNALGQETVYSSFSIAGSAVPISDNFLADASLNPSVWNNSVAKNPAGVYITPPTAAYALTWSIANVVTGFSLEVGSNLTTLPAWSSPSKYPVGTLGNTNQQLVDQSELPAGSMAFFNLIKYTFTQLQVLLPGQTNAPGTVLGYVGSPTPISLAAQGLNPTTVIVNACDSSWHIISGVSDTIHLTTSDGSAYLPADMNMANGTATFSGANGILFQSTGSQTVTAADLTSLTVTNSATSAAVTINP